MCGAGRLDREAGAEKRWLRQVTYRLPSSGATYLGFLGRTAPERLLPSGFFVRSEPTSGRATVNGFDTVREVPMVRRSLGTVLTGERRTNWELTGKGLRS